MLRVLLSCLAALAWASPSLLPIPDDQTAVIAAQSKAVPAGTHTPPIILISVDTLRADRVGCYGSTGVATP
jgi:hypothetical protein